MKNKLLILVPIITLVLAGCAIGPNYKRPTVDVPGDFRFAAYQSTNSFADLPWWEVFKDPTLLQLIREAVTNNYDLRQAVARVEQARNIAVAARAPLFPQIGYGGGVGRGRNALFNSSFPSMGATESSAQVNLNAFWEVDLWGRIRRMSEAARAEYLGTDNARRGVTIALVSEVAIAYFQLLQFDEELAIQRAATNAFTGSYQLFADRLNNGAASKLETDRAAAALANAASIVPRLELSIASTENQISVLLGRNPGPIERNAITNQPLVAPDIPAGLPSELLRRRPDVLASEQLLIAANADFVIEGYVDPTEPLRDEGPFGDHTGYYTLPEPYPVFHVTAITHRKDAVYPATIVGIPPMEDFYIGGASVKLFLPIFKMNFPEIVDIALPAEGVFHNLVFVSIKKTYPMQAYKIMHGLWGMGQMMFTKYIVVVDADVDVHNTSEVLFHLTANTDPQRDSIFTKGPADVLDHATSEIAIGSKLGIDATKKLAGEGFKRPWPPLIKMDESVKAKVEKLALPRFGGQGMC